MNCIAVLRHREETRLNHGKLAEIDRLMGPSKAEDFICCEMEEIAVLLADAERAFRDGRHVTLRAVAQNIARRAGGVGMSSLESSATNLAVASTRAGNASLAAVSNRMFRQAEQSFLAFWNHADVSI